MLVVTGFVLLALGLFAGIWLVLTALGSVAGDAGVALWLLFPGLTLAGYLMAASAAEPGQRSRSPSVLSGVFTVFRCACRSSAAGST